MSSAMGSAMSGCYYCGKNAGLVCDYRGPLNDWQACERNVCDEHSVAGFEDGDKQQFTLCKDHAPAQRKTGETVREWIERTTTL